jgi:hypothetical protein
MAGNLRSIGAEGIFVEGRIPIRGYTCHTSVGVNLKLEPLLERIFSNKLEDTRYHQSISSTRQPEAENAEGAKQDDMMNDFSL